MERQKSFNPLRDEPPTVCEAGGKTYFVDTDYRAVLDYIAILDGDDSEEDKTVLGLQRFFGDKILIDDVQELMEWLQWYVNVGQEPEKSNEAPMFDLLIDSGRVYAAFWQTYGINLRAVKMHWWLFVQLLEGLPKGTHLAEVIEIRGRKFEKWMKPADRNELQRLKDHYAIGKKADPIAGLANYLRGISE